MSVESPVVVILSNPESETHLLAREVEASVRSAGLSLTVRHSAAGLRDLATAASSPPECLLVLEPGLLAGMHALLSRGQTLVVGVLADLVVPDAWEHMAPPHAALVSHRGLVRGMAALGVPEAAVVATGVPLPASHATEAPDVARGALGVTAERALFLSGRGMGVGRIDRLLVQLGVLVPGIELFVDLDAADTTLVAQRMKLLGVRARRVRDVALTGRVLSACDAIVGAPTPLQALAALAGGRPVFVAEPSGDDQVGRAAFLEAHGAGGALVGAAGGAARLKELFTDSALEARTREACRRLFVPGAGPNVATALEGLIRNRQRLIVYATEARRTRVVSPEPEPAAPDVGLEDIGAGEAEVMAARERVTERAIRDLQVDNELAELKKRLGR